MKSKRAVVPVLFLAAAAASAVAQDLPIDDFTTGAYQSAGFKSGATHRSIQNGSMMGGSRDTNMFVCDPTKKGDCASRNPYNQASSYGFYPAAGGRAAAMVQTAGYDTGPRIDMGYGYQAAMDINFTGYQKIRMTFQGLTESLNFNIQLFTGTAYAQGGCNIPPYPAPFSVELPLNLFVQSSGFDFHHVNLIDVIFQSASAIGAVSFAATSIDLSNTTAPGLVIDCHY